MTAVAIRYLIETALMVAFLAALFVWGRESGETGYVAKGVAQEQAAQKVRDVAAARETQARIAQQVAEGIQSAKDDNVRLQGLYDSRDADARAWQLKWMHDHPAKPPGHSGVPAAGSAGSGTSPNPQPGDCGKVADRLEFFESVIVPDLREAVAEKEKADDQIASLLEQRTRDELIRSAP